MATIRELINEAADSAGELTGTPAQIAWAEKLADQRLDDIIATLRRAQDGLKDGIGTKEDFKAALQRGIKIAKITRAGFWIDQRNNSTTHLLWDEFPSNLK